MGQDSLKDTAGGGSMILVPVRWSNTQIERADAAASATGLTRSYILRAAFDQGIAAIERSIAALQAAEQVQEVGAVSGTGEPA